MKKQNEQTLNLVLAINEVESNDGVTYTKIGLNKEQSLKLITEIQNEVKQLKNKRKDRGEKIKAICEKFVSYLKNIDKYDFSRSELISILGLEKQPKKSRSRNTNLFIQYLIDNNQIRKYSFMQTIRSYTNRKELQTNDGESYQYVKSVGVCLDNGNLSLTLDSYQVRVTYYKLLA